MKKVTSEPVINNVSPISQSPTPEPVPVQNEVSEVKMTEFMTFGQACEAAVRGSKIRRASWQNPDVCCYMKGDILMIEGTIKDGQDHSLAVQSLDIIATDWVTIPARLI